METFEALREAVAVAWQGVLPLEKTTPPHPRDHFLRLKTCKNIKIVWKFPLQKTPPLDMLGGSKPEKNRGVSGGG